MKPVSKYFFEPTPLKAERWHVDTSDMEASRRSLAHTQLDGARVELVPGDKRTLSELRFLGSEALSYAQIQLTRWIKIYAQIPPESGELGAFVEIPAAEPGRATGAAERQKFVYLHDKMGPRTVPALKLNAVSAWSLPETSTWDLNFECTAWKGAMTGSTMLTFGYADLTYSASNSFSPANSASRKYTARLLNSISEVTDAVLHSQSFKDRSTPSNAIEATLRSEWLLNLEKARDFIWGSSESAQRAAANVSVACWTSKKVFVVSCGSHSVAVLDEHKYRLLDPHLYDARERDSALDVKNPRNAILRTIALQRTDIAASVLLFANFDVPAMLHAVQQKRPEIALNDVKTMTIEISTKLWEDNATSTVFSFIKLDKFGGLSC